MNILPDFSMKSYDIAMTKAVTTFFLLNLKISPEHGGDGI
jgi:hypothetical protein